MSLRTTVIATALAAGITVALAPAAGAASAPGSGTAPRNISVWSDCPEDPALNEFVTGKNADKGAYYLCVDAVRKARTPETEYAIVQAFWALGSPVACTPLGDREGDSYDSSSLISRSYASAGLDRFIIDGNSLNSAQILGQNGETRPDFIVATKKAKPGDILGYRTTTRAKLYFVNMSVGSGSVITAAGACGDVVRVTDTVKSRKKGPTAVGVYYVDPALARN